MTKLPAVDLDVPAPDGSRQHLLRGRARGVRPRGCAPRTGWRSPTPPSATPTSPCSRPGCAPATCSPSPATWPGPPRAVVARGVGRGDVRRGAALPVRGPVGAAGRAAPGGARTSASRCCCAAATRSATRRTRPRSPRRSSQEAAETGIDVFRIFDALNDVEQMRPAIEAVRATGTTVAEVALCYTGDLSDPDETLYTLDYYLRAGRADRRRRRARAGDQGHGRAAAGARRPHPGDRAARAVRPAGAPAHPRHPRRPARHPARRDRRRRRRRRRRLRLDGRHHVAAAAVRAGRRRPTTPPARPGCRWPRSTRWSPTGRRRAGSTRRSSPACRRRPAGSTATRSPAASSPTCASRRSRSASGEKFEQIEDMYAAANDILGNVVKVTPSSKVVGDLALHLVAVGADPAEFADDPGKFDIPDSVIGFLNGELGDPPGGWPEPFRTKALAGRTWKPPAGELDRRSRPTGLAAAPRERRDTLNELLFPGPTREFHESRETYGDVSVLPTLDYLYGLRRGEEHDGRPRGGQAAAPRPRGDQRARRARLPHGDGTHQRPDAPGQRPRPQRLLRGGGRREGRPRARPATWPRRSRAWSRSCVAEGDKVAAGETVATIEAMKMEASITAPRRRHRRAARARRHPGRRGRRPGAGAAG